MKSGFLKFNKPGVNMNELVHQLIREVGPGKMSSLAYDTAWVARLGEIDSELSGNALDWLCEHQLSDGSWGVEKPYYYHDRVISTLAAMIALTQHQQRGQHDKRIEKGLTALEKIIDGADEGLLSDPNGATVGFEMIVPTLVIEAEKLGIIKQQGDRILGRLHEFRKKKLELLKGKRINRHITTAFSAEMAGIDGQDMLDVENLQEENGSIGHSPSATSYYLIYIKPGDQKAIKYLQDSIHSGGAQDLYPFDVYERGWVLWNLNIFQSWESHILESFQEHLDYLNGAWIQGKGVSFSSGYSVPDGDNTIITFDLLKKFGYDVDTQGLLSFEEDTHFRCYQLELGISPSVNIHALIALKNIGLDLNHPTVQKVLLFLRKAQGNKGYWIDKWHSSPYYTTSHFVIACSNYDMEFTEKSVKWILDNQREDGSWGFFTATAEETAYCLHALSVWQEKTGKLPKEIIKHGLNWLIQNMDGEILPLWIGKGLYSVDLVVKSAILSAVSVSKSVL